MTFNNRPAHKQNKWKKGDEVLTPPFQGSKALKAVVRSVSGMLVTVERADGVRCSYHYNHLKKL